MGDATERCTEELHRLLANLVGTPKRKRNGKWIALGAVGVVLGALVATVALQHRPLD